MQLQPYDQHRSPLIDSIRAIALLGVIVMNIGAMVMRFIGNEVMAAAGPLDLGAMLVDLLLFQGKARSAFVLDLVRFAAFLVSSRENLPIGVHVSQLPSSLSEPLPT